MLVFQSTPPRGGRRRSPPRPGHPSGFNPRPRAGGDHGDQAQHSAHHGFNPRPRAGGDCGSLGAYGGVVMFQSTPPRGGRPIHWATHARPVRVSIHAPARGATQLTRASTLHIRFQSTPPRGGRLGLILGHVGHLLVSIHAPARGATPSLMDGRAARPSFNPRPRAGGDCPSTVRPESRIRFQSTPPRGGRPQRPGPPGRGKEVSIHAPARGATARSGCGR